MLTLVRIADFDALAARELAARLSTRIRRAVSVDPRSMEAGPAFRAQRGQYDSRHLLDLLTAHEAPPGQKLLGLCDVDLYASVFTYVFGEAHLGGEVAVLSSHRLRPEVYGSPADPARTRERLLVEAMHEWGHLSGAPHCREPGCAMNFSATVGEVDLKGPAYCNACAGSVLGEDQGAWHSVQGTSRQASPMSSG